MNQQLQKWVYLSYVAASGLLAYIVYQFLFWASALYDLEARVNNFDVVSSIASVALGAILFIFLAKHRKTNGYMQEVVLELSRVTWPTVNEAQKTTIVVMIMVVLAGIFLGLVDILWVWAFKNIL